jgi:hypothetical protein
MTFGMTVGVGGGGHVFNDAGKRDEKNCVKVSKERIVEVRWVVSENINHECGGVV